MKMNYLDREKKIEREREREREKKKKKKKNESFVTRRTYQLTTTKS